MKIATVINKLKRDLAEPKIISHTNGITRYSVEYNNQILQFSEIDGETNSFYIVGKGIDTGYNGYHGTFYKSLSKTIQFIKDC